MKPTNTYKRRRVSYAILCTKYASYMFRPYLWPSSGRCHTKDVLQNVLNLCTISYHNMFKIVKVDLLHRLTLFIVIVCISSLKHGELDCVLYSVTNESNTSKKMCMGPLKPSSFFFFSWRKSPVVGQDILVIEASRLQSPYLIHWYSNFPLCRTQ
jgi:hypothetical protein